MPWLLAMLQGRLLQRWTKRGAIYIGINPSPRRSKMHRFLGFIMCPLFIATTYCKLRLQDGHDSMATLLSGILVCKFVFVATLPARMTENDQ